MLKENFSNPAKRSNTYMLGIIGMGRIGKATARRASLALGMKVVYFNRSYIGSVDFPARPAKSIGHVMRESDIVSIHLPGDKGNHGLINEEQISLMKDSAFFINTSRGEVVDQKALIEALSTRKIAGGGLDVFEFVFAEHSGNPSPFPLIMYANVDAGVVVAGSSVLTTAFVVSTDAVVGTVVVVTTGEVVVEVKVGVAVVVAFAIDVSFP